MLSEYRHVLYEIVRERPSQAELRWDSNTPNADALVGKIGQLIANETECTVVISGPYIGENTITLSPQT